MRRSVVLFAVSLAIPAAMACSSSKSTSDGGTSSQEAGPMGPSLTCGSVMCPAGNDCCYDTTNTDAPNCTPSGTCPQSFLSCSSPANCASGQKCCFTYDNDAGKPSGHFHSECASDCPSTTTSYTLCDPAGNDCPSGEMCIKPTMGGGIFAFGGGYAPYCGMNNGFGNFFGDGGIPDFGDGGFANFFGDGGGFGNLFADGGPLSGLFGEGGLLSGFGGGFPPPGQTMPTPDAASTSTASDAAGD